MRLKLLLILLGCYLLPVLAFTQGQDFSKVEMKATKVAGNVYMLEGSGGNIGVSAGPDGLLIVDDQFAPLADKIKASLKQLNDGKLKFLINTHWHGDHTGGNAIFGLDSTIIAHTNVRKRLNSTNTVMGQTTQPAPKPALPVVTFDDSLSVHFNGEEIKVFHYPNGHTDGDGIIYFTGSNVVHMGDDFVTYGFPFVDLDSGGSVEGMAKTVADMIAKLPANVKIIPGHGPISTIDDMKKFHQMLVETSDIVRKQVQAKKSLDEIKAAGLPAKYDSLGKGFINTSAWIGTIYQGLSKSAGK